MNFVPKEWKYDDDVTEQELNRMEQGILEALQKAEGSIPNAGGITSAQAGLDASKPAPGIVGRLYIANDTGRIFIDTGTAWALIATVNWSDIVGKPTSFTPSAHASTHASGGSDPITPEMIGAAAAVDLNAHLNDTVYDGVHGLATTQDMTLYVDGTNGNDNNDGLTPQTAFKTIQKAVNSVPKIVNHIVTINVAPGDYSSEDVIIRGFSGGGLLELLGDTVVSDTRTVDRIYAFTNTLTINVRGFNCLGIDKAGVQASVCVDVVFEKIKIDNAGGDGVYVRAGNAIVMNSLISNRNNAMYARYLGQISSVGNTGTNNNTVFFADAGVIRKGGTQPSGTTQEITINGGQVI